jgi:hypothetical protein
VGLGATHPTTIETLTATSHGYDAETLTGREVLLHRRTTFHPRMCGLHRGAAAVAAALIGYIYMGLLPGRTRGGDDRGRLVPLYGRTTMLEGYSNSSAALCI